MAGAFLASNGKFLSACSLNLTAISGIDANATMELNGMRDAMTGLHDRRSASEMIVALQAGHAHADAYFGLIAVNLSGFRNVNHQFGFEVGDRLLIAVSERLRACLPTNAVLARMGGDEFLVMLTGLGHHGHAASRQISMAGKQLLTALFQPYHVACGAAAGQPITLCGRAGGKLVRVGTSSLNEMMTHLDWALYQARTREANAFVLYDEAQHASMQAFDLLQDALANALERAELSLQYQPMVDRSQTIIGMEALMRWNSDEYGQIPPAQFIPLAERSGAIHAMGAWALEQCCKQLAQWARDPHACGWTLSVNVSAHQFNQPSFVDEVIAQVGKHAVRPGRLILEVTESVFLNAGSNRHQRGFQRIREAGVGIAVDDFGTGFSSMCYLRNLSVSRVKIDKRFIDDLAVSKADQGIVGAILMLAHALDVDVVAEGVESTEQFSYLKRAGCSAFQGFLFGKPGELSSFL